MSESTGAPRQAWADRFEATPYVERLGCRLASFETDRVRLELPFRVENSNPGGALHGGIHASLVAFAGALAAESGLGFPDDYEAGVVDLSVAYLAAAVGEAVRAEGRVLRRGREIVFTEVSVENAEGRPLARGLLTYRAVSREVAQRASSEDPDPAHVDPDAFIQGPLDPGAMGRALVGAPFMGSLMTVDHMAGGRARLSMPARREALGADGSHHPGALAALLDSAGAMASWSMVPPGPHKAMTPGIQLSFVGPSSGEPVVALAQNLRKHAESFSNRVDLVTAGSGRPVAQGLLTYRIVVGEKLAPRAATGS
jgi:uncharacterized protein (TIGR00369 family)